MLKLPCATICKLTRNQTDNQPPHSIFPWAWVSSCLQKQVALPPLAHQQTRTGGRDCGHNPKRTPPPENMSLCLPNPNLPKPPKSKKRLLPDGFPIARKSRSWTAPSAT